ncbi:MAG: hypothetical protein J0M00_02730 [Burkholderiales bacterium]|nr:hypothetical protein [Burkholderiales bacterium]
MKTWLDKLIPDWPYRLRYGHAFPSLTAAEDPVVIFLDLIKTGRAIGARAPSDVEAVSDAELALGLQVRPVYAYVGDLHPALGRIGLILSGRWYRRLPLGVSRCDTGGLVGLKGGFGCLGKKERAEEVLSRLTMRRVPHWGLLFRMELFRCHGRLRGWLNYLRGLPPSKDLKDDRDIFIRSMGTNEDRRLWTWEARSGSPIEKGDLVAVALSPEAAKPILADYRTNPSAFRAIIVIVGSASARGIHHFDEEKVVRAFMGR